MPTKQREAPPWGGQQGRIQMGGSRTYTRCRLAMVNESSRIILRQRKSMYDLEHKITRTMIAVEIGRNCIPCTKKYTFENWKIDKTKPRFIRSFVNALSKSRPQNGKYSASPNTPQNDNKSGFPKFRTCEARYFN